jgi:integrase
MKCLENQGKSKMPCSIRLLPMVPPQEAPFHDFDGYQRLIDAAKALDWRSLLIVLLGGDAGLRCGEMMALKWSDIDLERRYLWVNHSEWRGKMTAPKGYRQRRLPLTNRLEMVLKKHRHLRSERVLSRDDGSPLTQKIVQLWAQQAARLAGVRKGVHILRHTFCSHLAMKGAPARAIQELAGHQDLKTTQRYMHLSPAAVESAIRLLDESAPKETFGEIVETDASGKTN